MDPNESKSSDAPISYEFFVPCPILTIELRCLGQPLPKISREQGQEADGRYIFFWVGMTVLRIYP